MQYVSASTADALARADEAVDLLLDSDHNPADILVLTVGSAHPWAQHELSFGAAEYWAQLAEGGDVFYADAFFADALPPDVSSSRPVRREVVVLAVNGGGAGTDSVAAAYERAVAHASSLLVVCGDAGPAALAAAAAGSALDRSL
ncbi:hypothetical protein ACWGB8_11965 [Kitasatospora sp. NPDC054939]